MLYQLAFGIRAAGVSLDRVASATPRGEVLARWLGSLLNIPVIPMNARLPEQRVALVVADDEDMMAAIQRNSRMELPVVLVQVVRDPSCTVTPVADLLGILGHGVDLPLEATLGAAADRTPPSILVKRLMADAEAEHMAVPSSTFQDWVRAHARWLSLVDPPALSARLVYKANIPSWIRSPDGRPRSAAAEPVSKRHEEPAEGSDEVLEIESALDDGSTDRNA